MKNFEKWEKELLEMAKTNDNLCISKKDNKPHKCVGMNCSDCLLKSDTAPCRNMLVQWLYEEYKEPIKLSHLEFELLKRLKGEKLEYLARDKCKVYVHAYGTKPQKGNLGWYTESRDCCCLSLFSNCFKLIKWEDKEPYKVQDILDNCEVVDDE